MMSKIASVKYDKNAKAPLWNMFIRTIFQGNQDLMEYVQRAAGYSLTGDVLEQLFFILNGHGSNGKSTFVAALSSMMGEYADVTDMQTFTNNRNDTSRNDLATMRGCRMITASETSRTVTLNSSLIKMATGGEKVRGKLLYADTFSFDPQFKIFLSTNYKPRINDNSEGMWRRVRIIPCNHHFDDATKDSSFPEKLKAEYPGILNWVIEGCTKWYQARETHGNTGFNKCNIIMTETDEYRLESDTLGCFLEDTTDKDPNFRAYFDDLYDAYRVWCDENNEKNVYDKRYFNKQLKERGIESVKAHGVMAWVGFSLKVKYTNKGVSKVAGRIGA
jgi:putative DNA primase/helicase